MFDRYTEKAKHAFFYAHQEALQHGATETEPIYLVLGLAQANPELLSRIGIGEAAVQSFRAKLPPENPVVTTAPTMFPFGAEMTGIIARAAKEADSAGQRPIASGHLLLGLYLASTELRSDLEKLGVTEETVRRAVLEEPVEQMHGPEHASMMRRYMGRPGIGYDLHRLEAGRRLMIGGVHVPFDKGPVGHSDGDVLAHAICDALLGASGMGDIGKHFPDTDPKWKGADSLIFLEHLRKLFEKQGLQIVHIDAVVITERPKLGSHFPAMREALAKALGIEAEQINLKAKTNEGVDAIGRGEAIAAHVVATITG
jgi:2-C-methyl-D-erythritol 2,4-cyclodiphosphate synthase|nr:2-C-methyl-D-erythritol 2,4-cyclodiphosphate synthase [Candidatus Acidoferrales bacterium]